MADGDRAAAPRRLLRASTSATLPPFPTCRPDSRTRPPFGSSCHTSRAIAWSRSSAAGSPLLGAVTQWSETNGGLPERGALIVDKVGFLAELCVKASVVLVGGSYDSRVHSVWEPAACAKPILTGPHIRNSAEASLSSTVASSGSAPMPEPWPGRSMNRKAIPSATPEGSRTTWPANAA